MILAYSNGFTELSSEEIMAIDGGVNWGNIGAGVFGMITIMAAVASAPVTVPLSLTVAAVYVAGSVASGYLVGSSF